MLKIICKKCGGETSDNVCENANQMTGQADECYAKWVKNRWVRGCAYDKQSPWMRVWVDRICGL